MVRQQQSEMVRVREIDEDWGLQVGEEARKNFSRWREDGFIERFLSGDKVLDMLEAVRDKNRVLRPFVERKGSPVISGIFEVDPNCLGGDGM